MKKSFALLLFFCAIFTLAQERKHTATENVKIISEKFEIPQLKTTRRIWIYLPKDYETSHKKYEVMYLQDAQNLFDDATSYAGEWQVDETLNKIFEKTGKSLIVVGIDNGGEKRMEELSPYKNAKYGGGNGENYVKFIIETLKPFIDKNYRTKPQQKFTTIGGSSLGALISVYAAVKHPETFGKVLAFSSAFWFNAKELNEFILSSKVNLKHQKYYFIQGKHEDEDMEAQTKNIIENLKSKNVKPKNIFLKIDEDGKHNEMYWLREFEGAVLWLN
jgi:alpha-glucosidase